ncbi:MAG: hypothetical protein FWE24_05310 [Defluviitaleaceae bacterium]|nr:hypothetical protein [Defluviitaleaceae bacterium]
MELFKDILTRILESEEIHVVFPNLELSSTNILVEMKSFETLQKIKATLENSGFTDFQCIEEIIFIFEETGSGINRHDWHFD